MTFITFSDFRPVFLSSHVEGAVSVVTPFSFAHSSSSSFVILHTFKNKCFLVPCRLANSLTTSKDMPRMTVTEEYHLSLLFQIFPVVVPCRFLRLANSLTTSKDYS
jgi:hypothetical protein